MEETRRGAAPLSTLETYRSSVADAKCGDEVNMVTGVSEACEALGVDHLDQQEFVAGRN